MMRGVVLSGGESKRMGSDKGMLLIGTQTWAERAAQQLLQLEIPVVISVNASQWTAYRQIFEMERLIVDQIAVKGPLTGLLSVHLAFPDDDLLLLACDMTEMDVQTLQVLKDFATTFPGYENYCFVGQDFIEPLCAIYTSVMLKKLYLELQAGQVSTYSLVPFIRKGKYRSIPIKDCGPFNNHNSL